LVAKDLRSKAKNVELLKKEKEKLLDEYIRYGKDYYAGNLIYIKKYGDITMYNLVTGEQQEIQR
jgi:ATP phosphoribosyltransferase regulatory subunit